MVKVWRKLAAVEIPISRRLKAEIEAQLAAQKP